MLASMAIAARAGVARKAVATRKAGMIVNKVVWNLARIKLFSPAGSFALPDMNAIRLDTWFACLVTGRGISIYGFQGAV